MNIHKRIEHNGIEVETPLKGLQVGKLNSDESVMPEARNVVEIYARADDTKLRASRGGSDVISRNLRSPAKRASEDELIVAFVEYTETTPISTENAKELLKHQSNYGDILAVPLQKELIAAADDGDGFDTSPVKTFYQNAETYLQAADTLGINKPMLGTIPSISAELTDRLYQLYSSHGMDGYCVDFSRRTVTAQTQLTQVVEPLMGTLGDANELSSSLIYAVNLLNQDTSGQPETSPEHLFAFTIGFDIVGDVHASPNIPEDVFEPSEEFKVLDMDADSYRKVQPDALDGYIPSKSAFTPREIRDKIKAKPKNRFRLRKPVNTELVTEYLDAVDQSTEELLERLQQSDAAIDTKLDALDTTIDSVQS